ncbi:hypothetical protein [Actinomadura miaoliensis]|uniref:Uncharacterized protein n=1 Tax=Actinomadura miaoliensis TaxID=430685 RepID=A0ABP7UWQ5_9ACTN
MQCRAFSDLAGSGEVTVWLLDNRGPGTGSWASVEYEPGADEYTVEQAGDRRLWDETEAAYLWWLRVGRPGRERFGMTVTLTGQNIWLDSPENVIRR